jgi:hypothetical protein
MDFTKATVHLTEDDIKRAIGAVVAEQGWAVGKITLIASPHQYNGPDSFSASVEVEAREYDQPKSPPTGWRDMCRDCKREIEFDGKCWDHVGESKPRHPARPDAWRA